MKKFFTLLVLAACCAAMTWGCSDDKYDDTEIRQEIENLTYIIHSGFISGYQNRYGDNLKPPTNVYHRMTA